MMARKKLAYGIDTFTGRLAHLFFNMGWDTLEIARRLNATSPAGELYTEGDIYNHMPAVHELRRKRLQEAA